MARNLISRNISDTLSFHAFQNFLGSSLYINMIYRNITNIEKQTKQNIYIFSFLAKQPPIKWLK